MDSTLLAGIFGLIGSLIGGCIGGWASYKGSNKASEQQIKAQQDILQEQREKESEQRRQSVITSARIIYIDLFTAIRESVRLANRTVKPNIGIMPNNISVATNFSEHVANLSSDLTFEELVLVNKLYGLIDKLQHEILNSNSLSGNYDTCRYAALNLISELFESNYSGYVDGVYHALDEQTVISSMENEYRVLCTKIKKLTQM